MKIFLTGGTGFIGSHFINHALDAGHELICIRRPGSRSRIPLIKEPVWYEGSLKDDWQKQLNGCDLFLHLAAHSTNVPYDKIENCIYWNLIVSLKILQKAKAQGIDKFIIAGTGFEYGKSGEEYDFIPVNASLYPIKTYPASKAAASIIFFQWAVENKLKLKYLRIFQVFGEGEADNRLWPSLKRAALSGEDYDLTEGEQVRDFTPVKKVADDLISSLNFDNIEPGTPLYKNVGDGNPQTIRKFAEYWWEKWGAKGKLNFGKIPYRENEVMRFIPEI